MCGTAKVRLKRLKQAQSASSLRVLLTDPLAFLWQYCLGWWEPHDLAGEQPVILDGLAEGSLYHEILQCAVKKLERMPGAMAKASPASIEAAVNDAVREVSEAWARTNPTPPPRIWQRVLARGREVALSAFKEMPAALPDQHTYVEIPFGYADRAADGRPWDPAVSVAFNIDGFSLPLQGRIDRLDISGDRTRARVLDYKTVGVAPEQYPGLKRGQELQRCVYAYVVRQLIAGAEVEAALMYPGQENGYLPLTDTDSLLAQLGAIVACAASNAQQGRLPFGASAEEKADRNYEYAPLFA
ncbi:MAG: PD-(D/E)XK nuclease family protein, partial [Candidatus Sulfotelmatobacter sp.]